MANTPETLQRGEPETLQRGQLGLFGVIMPGLAQVAPATPTRSTPRRTRSYRSSPR